MSRKKLTIAMQLEVVKEAKEHYETEYSYCMCGAFMKVLFEKHKIGCDIDTLHFYLPFFTKAKMTKLGDDGLIPVVTGNCYWWELKRSNGIRSKVFDYLISELEKQL